MKDEQAASSRLWWLKFSEFQPEFGTVDSLKRHALLAVDVVGRWLLPTVAAEMSATSEARAEDWLTLSKELLALPPLSDVPTLELLEGRLDSTRSIVP